MNLALGSIPASAWERVGVMVPYLNMLYNEAGTAQLSWNLSDKEDTAVQLSMVYHGNNLSGPSAIPLKAWENYFPQKKNVKERKKK